MLRKMKLAAVRLMKSVGALERIRDSRWRQEHLLILCYHAVSIEDEHEWRPSLCMGQPLLRERLEILRDGGYNVLPLGEAVTRLAKKDLPPRSVVLTFDDGGYDFYVRVAPLLREFKFPATVYQTTYYTDYPKPIFRTASSYLLWKARGKVVEPAPGLGISQTMDLRTEEGRQRVMAELVSFCQKEDMTGAQKNDLLERLAKFLGLDWEAFLAKRLLQVMRPNEIAEMSAEGFDIQLHTHRHRTPIDATLFRKEISDNRKRIVEICGKNPTHFCYPSGHYEMAFLPWLKDEQVVSATTCDPGLADSESDPLLLPRFIDTPGQPSVMFEAWVSGAGHLVSTRRPAASARSSERAAVAKR